MGMTMAQKILARHSGRRKVEVGEWITAKVDHVCIHDSFLEIQEGMEAAGIEGGLRSVWDKDRVMVIIDHNAPAVDKNVMAMGKRRNRSSPMFQ